MSRARYWCFTLNNYDQKEIETLQDLVSTEGNHVTYVCFGREVGANGTPHLQGYIELSKRCRITQLKQLCKTQRIHLEKRLGNADQAIEYCKKDGDFKEFGQKTGVSQGRRTDLENLKETLDSGADLAQVADEHFSAFLRYPRAISAYRSLRLKQRTWKPEVTVFWGPTGTGKTRRSLQLCNERAWIYSSDGWFDGYDGDENVIFDDFGGHEFKLTFLLKLLDRYPMRVRIKGGFVNWIPRKIFITSNTPPDQWYTNAKLEHREALLRRLETIEEMDKPYFSDIEGYEE